MGNDVPDVREAQYRLLGLQAIPFADGIIIRRGRLRLFLRGGGLGDLLDLMVRRSAEGDGISLAGLMADVEGSRHTLLKSLFDRLTAERILVRSDGADGGERPEDVFYWNHGASAAVGRALRRPVARLAVQTLARALRASRWSLLRRAKPITDWEKYA